MVPARPLTKLVLMKSAAIVAMSLMLAACNRSHGPSAAERAAQARAEAAFKTAQQAWRAQRVAELTKPDGWTSLIGLHLLDDGVHRVGSGADNGIRLLMGPPRLGLFTLRDGKVSFSADAEVSLDGQPSRGGALRSDHDAGGPDIVSFDEGKGLLAVIERGDRLWLRVKHADADSRLRFTGLTYWPGGRDWQVQARCAPPSRRGRRWRQTRSTPGSDSATKVQPDDSASWCSLAAAGISAHDLLPTAP